MLKRFTAFTLIELLVTIAIISILATIAGASYSNVRRNSRDTRRKQSANAYATAMQAYRIKNGTYFVTYDDGTNTYCTGLDRIAAVSGVQYGVRPDDRPGYQYPNNESSLPSPKALKGKCVGYLGYSTDSINEKGKMNGSRVLYPPNYSIGDALIKGGYLQSSSDISASNGFGVTSLFRCDNRGRAAYTINDAHFSIAVNLEGEISYIESDNMQYYCSVQQIPSDPPGYSQSASIYGDPWPKVVLCRKEGDHPLNAPYNSFTCGRGSASYVVGDSPISIP